MTPADQKLRALFDDDLPPARDVIFQESVLPALDRRILWQEISILAAACGSGMILLWMLLPSLEPVLVSLGRVATPGLTILALCALVWGQDMWRPRRSGS